MATWIYLLHINYSTYPNATKNKKNLPYLCRSWLAAVWAVGLSHVPLCDLMLVCLESTGSENNTHSEGKQRRCTGAYSSWLMKGSQIWRRLARRRTAFSMNINFRLKTRSRRPSPGTELDTIGRGRRGRPQTKTLKGANLKLFTGERGKEKKSKQWFSSARERSYELFSRSCRPA